MKTRRVRFFRVIEFTFERTFEFLSKRNEVEAIFLALALFPRVEREIFQRPAWIKLHNKVKSRNYQNINGQLVSPRLSMLTDFRRPLFPLLFFNDYLLSVFSRTREEIREQRRSWTRSKYMGGIVSISYSKKRSNFNRYLYIYHISVQMLDARRLTRPSPPKIPSDNCYNFTVLLSYSTETQKHAQLHIDYMYT